MEEAKVIKQPVKEYQINDLVFRYFPDFAAFVRDNYLVPYIKEQIRISREVSLPMLKYFEGMGDDELVMIAIESHRSFLTDAAGNNLKEHIEQSLKRWIADELGVLKREEVTAEDINLAGYMRNKALLHFLPAYTADVHEAIEIINEINALTVTTDIAATNVYIRLLKNRINEQALLTEALSNTTPGLNYILDLKNKQVRYANKNTLQFFGNTLQEITELGGDIIAHKVHPDDVAVTIDELDKCSVAADGDTISWELRLKTADDNYLWMRNYASVYKRDESGEAVEIVGIILDIHNEKAIAEKLLLREKQLLAAQDQAQLGSFELDIETGRMNVTPQFKKIFESEEADLQKLAAFVHPADQARILANRNRAISEGSVYDNEYRYIINGKEKILWSRGTVIDKNGRKVMTGTVMDITSRHKMLQELLESRDLYKQAQTLSHIGNWECDLRTNEYTWSDELYHIYEMEPHPGPVDPILAKEYRYAEDIPLIEDTVKRLKESHTPCDYTFRIKLPSGKLKHLHVIGAISYDKDGVAASMFGTVQDVTEKQLLIERLQNSDVLYKQAQAISHIGNWSWDVETKKLEWSDELYRIYELDSLNIDPDIELALYNHPQDEVLIRDSMKHTLLTLEPMDFNYRIILKDGKIKTLHVKGEVKTGSDGHAVKIYGTVQDITEQKNVEKQLKEIHEFSQKITDTTPSIIAAYNIHTGKYSFVNKAIEKQLGYPQSKIMEEGTSFLISIIHPDDLPMIMEQNTLALEAANKMNAPEEEPIVEFKYRMKNSNGVYRWVHTYGTIFERDETGLVESVLNITFDITEQEEAEQIVFRKNLQLQQSNTSLEEYAYVASHDLKEPLRKIVTFSDRILTTQAQKLDAEGQQYLGKVIDASRRMQKMISDLLYVSTISGNKDFQMCDLNVLLQEAIFPLDHKIEELHAEVEADKLPTISVVPSQFIQLFQNLIGNSLKFGRKDVPAHIKIRHGFLNNKAIEHLNLIKARKYLKIEVEDNGIGFDDQYSNKIFSIFQRLHTKTEYEGTGIGLAVCKKIVENHNGIISAKGKLNEGATFSIIIPV